MNIITIDCGASFLKGALFQDDKMMEQKQVPSTAVHGNEDILQIIQIDKLVEQVYDLVRNLSRGINQIKLCISNEMHGFILCHEDGTPYTDYISWQKEYGNIAIDGQSSVEILSQPSFTDDIYYTGMGLRGGLPNANLLYLSRASYLKTGETYRFYTLGDYIIRRLSGKEPICHPTNAAATGLYDFRISDWNKTLIELASTHTVFPKIGINPINFELDGMQVECLPAIGDQQAALLGSGLNDASDLSFNLGTGAQVSCLVSEFEREQNYSIQIRPYFNGLLLRTMPHLPSGRAINVYIRFLKSIFSAYNMQIEDDKIWNVLQREMDGGHDTAMSVDMSFFQNPLTANSTGSIDNIGEYDLTIGNLIRTVFQQMADNFFKAASIIQPDTSKTKRIVFSGGVARKNEYLRTLILTHFCKDISRVIAKDETLYGLNKYGSNN